VRRGRLVLIVRQNCFGRSRAEDMKAKRGGMKGKLIVFLIILAGIVGGLVYFAGKADDSLPAPEEKRIEVEDVL
jgi:hypothetical protein